MRVLVYLYVCVLTNVFVCIFTSVCMYVCMYVYMCLRVCICMCICMCIYICIYVYECQKTTPYEYRRSFKDRYYVIIYLHLYYKFTKYPKLQYHCNVDDLQMHCKITDPISGISNINNRISDFLQITCA